MKIVSYWENAPGRVMPPYIALCLATMEKVFGNSFELLTPKTTPSYIGTQYLQKNWHFDKLDFDFSPEVVSIVAKSDFIRMAYVYHQGGCWIDADSIVFENLLPIIYPQKINDKMRWHSEVLFGAIKGNEILSKAMCKSLIDDVQTWANPGGIKTLIKESTDKIQEIPFKYLNPGYTPAYNFNTCEVLMRKDISTEQFLVNNEAKMMKLYNNYFSRSLMGRMSITEFLHSDTLLSKIFLKIDSNKKYWIDEGNAIIASTKN